jgi:hypothetical protein
MSEGKESIMNTETLDIRLDMEVYGCEGAKIGAVAHIYRVLPEAEGSGAAAEMHTTIASAITYLQVGSGGILGLGAKELYIPITAVETAAEGCVTLKCTKSECLDRYATKPAGLDETREEVSSTTVSAR